MNIRLTAAQREALDIIGSENKIFVSNHMPPIVSVVSRDKTGRRCGCKFISWEVFCSLRFANILIMRSVCVDQSVIFKKNPNIKQMILPE